MATESKRRSRRWSWRAALLTAILLPLLPEIAIVATYVIAERLGCQVGGETACMIGPGSASAFIRTALEASSLVALGFGSGIAVLWLAACYFFISQGWTRLSNQLLLAFAVSLIFAFLPYVGPILSIGHLANPNCQPNEGGVGPCEIYGGDVGNVAHDSVTLSWLAFYGAPMAFGAFFLYVMIAITVYVVLLMRRQRTEPRESP